MHGTHLLQFTPYARDIVTRLQAFHDGLIVLRKNVEGTTSTAEKIANFINLTFCS
jgi:hypothetical protein